MKPLEKLGFAVLVLLMTLMSATSVIAARQARSAAEKTDLIAQCTTPGTTCAKLQADGELRRASQTMCIVLIDLPPAEERDERRDEILRSYLDCVNDTFDRLKSSPLPGVGITPTTEAGDQ